MEGTGTTKNLFPISSGRVPTGHVLTCSTKGDRLAGHSRKISGVLTAGFQGRIRQQREKKSERKRGTHWLYFQKAQVGTFQPTLEGQNRDGQLLLKQQQKV